MKSNSTQETTFILTEKFTIQHIPADEAIQRAVALWLEKEIRRSTN